MVRVWRKLTGYNDTELYGAFAERVGVNYTNYANIDSIKCRCSKHLMDEIGATICLQREDRAFSSTNIMLRADE